MRSEKRYFRNFALLKANMVDSLSNIKEPIKKDLERFNEIFSETLKSSNTYLSQIISSIGKNGKQVRPILLLLVAKEFGSIQESTYLSAATLEILHTASLIHDDVVDESNERRGIKSLNYLYGNKVAVLTGDYILSSALLSACRTNLEIVTRIAELGRQLSEGEIIQMKNASEKKISENSYFEAIRLKTASLFSMCCELGAMSVNAPREMVIKMRQMGEWIGICFQIRDDIFDYYDDNIGKPTGNDLAEGKLTLPLLYALSHYPEPEMVELAMKVRQMKISEDEISALVNFAKRKGGIEYAHAQMLDYAQKAKGMIVDFTHPDIRQALSSYIDFVTERKS